MYYEVACEPSRVGVKGEASARERKWPKLLRSHDYRLVPYFFLLRLVFRLPQSLSRHFARHEGMTIECHAVDALGSNADPPAPLVDTAVDDRAAGVEDVSTPLKTTHLFSSSSDWLDEFFDVDASDVLLGSFTCALKRGILIQGKLFVVAGERGKRVLFHSSLFRRVTTLEVSLQTCTAVEKKNSAGALSALKISHGDGEALVFCSLFYRENAYRCVHQAWRRAVDGPLDAPQLTISPPPIISPQIETQTPPVSHNSGLDNSEPPKGFVAPSSIARFPPPGVDDSSRRVLRFEFPEFDPEVVYHALFDPDGALLTKHLGLNCGATEIQITKRKIREMNENSRRAVAERYITYSAPCQYKFPNMPQRCEVRDVQVYTVEGGGRTGGELDSTGDTTGDTTEPTTTPTNQKKFTMRSCAAMSGAPFADCFVVESLIRVTSLGSIASDSTSGASPGVDPITPPPAGTVLEGFCDIEWKKPVNSILKGLVHRGARDSLKKSYNKMVALCTERMTNLLIVERATIAKLGEGSFFGENQTTHMSCSLDYSEAEAADVQLESISRSPTVESHSISSQTHSQVQTLDTEVKKKQIKDFTDAAWFIPAVILVTVVLFGLYTALFTCRMQGFSNQALKTHRHLLFDASNKITKEGVRAALRDASRDDALLDAVVRFLND